MKQVAGYQSTLRIHLIGYCYSRAPVGEVAYVGLWVLIGFMFSVRRQESARRLQILSRFRVNPSKYGRLTTEFKFRRVRIHLTKLVTWSYRDED